MLNVVKVGLRRGKLQEYHMYSSRLLTKMTKNLIIVNSATIIRCPTYSIIRLTSAYKPTSSQPHQAGEEQQYNTCRRRQLPISQAWTARYCEWIICSISRVDIKLISKLLAGSCLSENDDVAYNMRIGSMRVGDRIE